MFATNLGRLGEVGSGSLNMAIVGGESLPSIQGAIANHIGPHHSFFASPEKWSALYGSRSLNKSHPGGKRHKDRSCY